MVKFNLALVIFRLFIAGYEVGWGDCWAHNILNAKISFPQCVHVSTDPIVSKNLAQYTY